MNSLLLAIFAAVPAASDHVEAGAIISLPPLVGVVLSPTDKPGVSIYASWVLKLVSEEPRFLRPTQVVIEPGVVIRATTSFTFRTALRWMREPLPWLSLGGGVGMGLEAAAQTRPVISAELVARLGTGPLYFWLVTTRAELRMDGTTAWMLSAGRTYW